MVKKRIVVGCTRICIKNALRLFAESHNIQKYQVFNYSKLYIAKKPFAKKTRDVRSQKDICHKNALCLFLQGKITKHSGKASCILKKGKL